MGNSRGNRSSLFQMRIRMKKIFQLIMKRLKKVRSSDQPVFKYPLRNIYIEIEYVLMEVFLGGAIEFHISCGRER